MEERIVTPLGPVLVTLSRADEGVRIERSSTPPPSPDGMSQGAALQIVFTRPLVESLTVSVAFDAKGDAETGEWLECCTFDLPEGRLSIAARDTEWLAPEIDCSWASYLPNGFRLDVQTAAPGSRLPIAAAWRLGSPSSWPDDDISTWLAADSALPFRNTKS